MAFQTFQELGGGGTQGAVGPCRPQAGAEARELSALEWQVVSVARADRPSSLRRPGRFGRLVRAVSGGRNPMLADPRLEALRRIAVLTWQRGYAVPPQEVRAFLAAGYTDGQYETLADRIGAQLFGGARARA